MNVSLKVFYLFDFGLVWFFVHFQAVVDAQSVKRTNF